MFKRFFLGILFRIAILTTLIGFLAFSLTGANLFLNSMILFIGTIVVFLELLNYLNRTYNDLQYFLDALYYDDLSQIPAEKFKDKRLRKLYTRLQTIRHRFREKRIEKEEELAFLKEAILAAPIGILSWDESGKIQLFNPRLQKNIALNSVNNISRLKHLRPLLWAELEKIPIGSTGIMKYEYGEEVFKLSARKIQIRQNSQQYTFALIQNIGEVLDNVEMNAWEKLINILTHELMNGATIISSLSSTMVNILESEQVNEQDLIRAATAINKRSEGLVRFVEDYRLLSQVPSPKLAPVKLRDLFDDSIGTWAVSNPDIDIQVSGGKSVTAKIDADLFHQVFDNLMLNSSHALLNQKEKKINIEVEKKMNDRVQINFSDNGCGMDKDTLAQATIPFYTTRATGSGIGLALSRQIIRGHNGTLHIVSNPKKGTKIVIHIPLG